MSYETETVSCAVCGLDNYSTYIEKARDLYNDTQNFFDIVKCNSCGFVFTNPRPTKETMNFFYPDSAGYYAPVSPTANVDSQKEKIIRTILARYYGYEIESPYGKIAATILNPLVACKMASAHVPKFIKNGRLLDIGCSWGLYLWKMAQYGWDVHGVELNDKAADYAINTLGFKNIRKGFFEDYDWHDDFFDVVHMSMVLEHLHSPVQNLCKVAKTLKPDGQLILSVPDISGFEARVYKRNAYTLQAPQHLNHFSPKTITMTLKKAGFKVEKIAHQNFDRDMVASAGYLENKIPAKILHNRIVRKTFVKSFVSLLALLGKTSRMTVYARKQNA